VSIARFLHLYFRSLKFDLFICKFRESSGIPSRLLIGFLILASILYALLQQPVVAYGSSNVHKQHLVYILSGMLKHQFCGLVWCLYHQSQTHASSQNQCSLIAKMYRVPSNGRLAYFALANVHTLIALSEMLYLYSHLPSRNSRD